MDIQMPDSVRDTIRYALNNELAETTRDIDALGAIAREQQTGASSPRTGISEAQEYWEDVSAAKDYFEDVLVRIGDATDEELHSGSNRITMILGSLNSTAQSALRDYARSPMAAGDVGALAKTVDRASVAATWLHTVREGLKDPTLERLNETPFSLVVADIIAAQAIAKQPERIRDILMMRDLVRSVGMLERQAQSARIHQPSSVKEPAAIHAYFAQQVGHAATLAEAVADRFSACDIDGFGLDTYQKLTRSLRYVLDILRPSVRLSFAAEGK